MSSDGVMDMAKCTDENMYSMIENRDLSFDRYTIWV